jgi:chromate transporter
VTDLLELFTRFVIISLLAFGGGGAALSLVERTAVHEHAWITTDEFAAAVSFGYVTPGPILILSAFVGYYVAGFAGSVAATCGAFVLPWALAAAAARQLRPFMQHPRLRGFGRAAAPAVVALLGVTVLSLARSGVTNIGYLAVAGSAALLAAWTKANPAIILILGAAAGLLIGTAEAATSLPSFRLP